MFMTPTHEPCIGPEKVPANAETRASHAFITRGDERSEEGLPAQVEACRPVQLNLLQEKDKS